MIRDSDPIVVIGGGGAGIIAAWRAAFCGAPVTLYERNRKLGIKLLISGGGKCNITHAGSIEELCSAFLRREALFLRPAFHRFSNDEIVKMIQSRGIATYVRPNGRVFPVSGNADDVVEALLAYLDVESAKVELNSRVCSITAENGCVSGVNVEGGWYPSRHVIIATGGISYPRTGTTGDGYRMARSMGHTIVPLRPALAPIAITPPLPHDWRGVALRGGYLSVHAQGKKLTGWRDDVLVTHEGLSGPAALEVSRTAALALEHSTVSVEFDFFPEREFTELDADLSDKVLAQRAKMISSVLESWLPNRMIPRLLNSIGVEPTRRGYSLTRKERRAITGLLKSWHVGTISQISIDRGEVTAGGVCLDEVDPHSMRSRKMPGLYLCGEVLDIAGRIGGYNLQAAFSTGFVAGESAARDLLSNRAAAIVRESSSQG